MCIRYNNILSHTYETEIQSASFYQTPATGESIVKKWECITIIYWYKGSNSIICTVLDIF